MTTLNNTERFSMNEFQPLTMDEKKFLVENKISAINKKKEPFIMRKQEIELELSKYKAMVVGKYIEPEKYQHILECQGKLKDEKFEIEKAIHGFKKEVESLNRELEVIRMQIKKIPDGNIKKLVIDMRDRYMAFASDTTRVSSMRAMASKFVEELQSLLTEIK